MKNTLLIVLVLIAITPKIVLCDQVNVKKLDRRSWTLTESPNFRILSDAKPKDVLKIAQQLERFRAFSSLLMGVEADASNTRSDLTVTKSRSTWKALGLDESIVSSVSLLSDGRSLIFSDMDGFRGNSLRSSNSGRATVFNALAWDLFRDINLRPRVPLWYYRGFASYLAGYSEKESVVQIGELQAMGSRLRSLYNSGGFFKKIDMRSLMTRKSYVNSLTKKELSDEARIEFAAQAFILVHYFYADFDRRKQLSNYIALENQGIAFEERLQQAFGQNEEQLYLLVREYAGKSLMVPTYDKEMVFSKLSLPSEQQFQQRKLGVAQFWQIMYPRLVGMSDKQISSSEKKELNRKVKQHLPQQTSVFDEGVDQK